MISVTFRREKGQCRMFVDSALFHTYLKELGVATDAAGNFLDPPRATRDVVDINNHELSTKALLKPCVDGRPNEFDLASAYGNNPPSMEQLKKLCASVKPVAERIIEHYRPIEISVKVIGKKGQEVPIT